MPVAPLVVIAQVITRQIVVILLISILLHHQLRFACVLHPDNKLVLPIKPVELIKDLLTRIRSHELDQSMYIVLRIDNDLQ